MYSFQYFICIDRAPFVGGIALNVVDDLIIVHHQVCLIYQLEHKIWNQMNNTMVSHTFETKYLLLISREVEDLRYSI